MGFDIGRRRAAVVHAGQLLHLVFLLLTTERVGYRNWVKVITNQIGWLVELSCERI